MSYIRCPQIISLLPSYSRIFFALHLIGIILTNILWLVTPKVIPLHLLVILSWFFNSNKCLISQIEYKYFDRTFMGEGKNYYVPRKQRYLLYLNFILGIMYHHNFILRYLKIL